MGFYELLQVAPDAPADAIRVAYQEQIAQVVRKLRALEARQQDVAPLEARRSALGEAWGVLSDPQRRRRYDRFRELSRTALPGDPEALWAQAGPSLVDPAAAGALEVVRTLTDLRVGEPVGIPVAPVVEPEVSPVHVRIPEPPPSSSAETVVVSSPRVTAQVGGHQGQRPTRPVAGPVSHTLTLDRSVPSEDLARLLDQYGPTGAFLRAVRDLRRISLDSLSANTRISMRFLDALERDAYTDLPGATFVRGYLKMLVRALEAIGTGADTDEFVEGYMSRFHRARG